MRQAFVVLSVVALCCRFTMTDSRTSTLWRLEGDRITTGGRLLANGASATNENTRQADDDADAEAGDDDDDDCCGCNRAAPARQTYAEYDEVFHIITSTASVRTTDGSGWIVRVHRRRNGEPFANETLQLYAPVVQTPASPPLPAPTMMPMRVQTLLDCGERVNYTRYDYLLSVGTQLDHPPVPDPDAVYLFLKTPDRLALRNFNISALERRLRRARQKRPHSAHLYNQIGNYWRIIGDASRAISCFRRALTMTTAPSEVLLNLAQVAYSLQYLDDAIHLARRSLELQPAGRSTWRHYLTMGEIFRAYGHLHESASYLRQALKLHPQHEPILRALRQLETRPRQPIHLYTLLIIVLLVLAVGTCIACSFMLHNKRQSNNSQHSHNNSNSKAVTMLADTVAESTSIVLANGSNGSANTIATITNGTNGGIKALAQLPPPVHKRATLSEKLLQS